MSLQTPSDKHEALLSDWQAKNDDADTAAMLAKEVERDFMVANAQAVMTRIAEQRAWEALEAAEREGEGP